MCATAAKAKTRGRVDPPPPPGRDLVSCSLPQEFPPPHKVSRVSQCAVCLTPHIPRRASLAPGLFPPPSTISVLLDFSSLRCCFCSPCPLKPSIFLSTPWPIAKVCGTLYQLLLGRGVRVKVPNLALLMVIEFLEDCGSLTSSPAGSFKTRSRVS